VTNPGVLLVRGDIGGVWRQKRSRDRFHITVRPFDALTSEQRRALDTDAQTIARHAGAGEVETTVE
jgi:hypothetical protein